MALTPAQRDAIRQAIDQAARRRATRDPGTCPRCQIPADNYRPGCTACGARRRRKLTT